MYFNMMHFYTYMFLHEAMFVGLKHFLLKKNNNWYI
jgi:hypothetical protein